MTAELANVWGAGYIGVWMLELCFGIFGLGRNFPAVGSAFSFIFGMFGWKDSNLDEAGTVFPFVLVNSVSICLTLCFSVLAWVCLLWGPWVFGHLLRWGWNLVGFLSEFWPKIITYLRFFS